MVGTLYIVGTPIGNLEDLSLRALRVLREVDVIAAEDTRRTARLLQHYSIATPATSLHEHNERTKASRLVQRLLEGEAIALVSDAGMPLVSDPGAWFVKEARAAGVAVEVVPGPSAITALLAGAGVSGPFAFLGFPPSSGRARREWLATLGRTTYEMTAVFFESPHRVRRTLEDIQAVLGDVTVTVGRELTKAHEELVNSPISELLGDAVSLLVERGEFVLLVEPREPVDRGAGASPSDEDLAAEMGEMTERGGMRPREAAKSLAAKYQVDAGRIYDLHAKRSK